MEISQLVAKAKEQLNKELRERPLYLCDPQKNADCPKTYCAYLHPGFEECRHTSDIRFAEIDDEGNAIRIMNADEL